MTGKTLGHYEIREPLGAGGMGEVYRAHDTTLKRDVAIKVLSEAFTADPDRLARLEREAHMLASLNHPNIATIYSLERARGTRFLVLELVKGESLEQLLATGPLPLERALDVCRQIAGALEVAHEQGIIHRDLKPANVLITPEGRAKVLDFGIAKTVPAVGVSAQTARATDLTVAGSLVGTVPYMSPEQVRGGRIDQRSDIWAFGCLLYEALTARNAFARETVADTLASIIDQEPDWALLRRKAPESVRTLVRRCLQKNPGARLHDIADARIEIADALDGCGGPGGLGGRGSRGTTPSSSATSTLRSFGAKLSWAALSALLVLIALDVGGLRSRLSPTGSGARPGPARSIAVLPLQNLSGNPEDDAFADGMTEEITTQLAKLPELRVTARSAALRFGVRPVDFAEVGEVLGVDAVLDGSIRRSGDRLRVSAQLVEVAGSVNLWVDDFDGEWTLDSLIGLQEEIALQIAATLDIRLSPQQRDRLTRVRAPDPQAYELYLRGISHLVIGDRDEHMIGVDLLRQAIAVDPEFADAHARLATAYALVVEWGYDADPVWLELAEGAAHRALALSPDSPAAYEALLAQSYQRGDPREVRELSKKLLAADPNNVTGHFMLGYVYVRHGFLDAGEREFRLALRADPFFLPARMNMSTIEDGRGDLAAAEQRMEELLGEYPEQPLLSCFLAYYLAKQGMIGRAMAVAEPLLHVHPLGGLMLALIYSLDGDFESARRMETPELIGFVDSAPWPAYYMAQVYALQSRTEEAVELLEGQVGFGFPYGPLEDWPAYAPIRDQPRFQRLIEDARQAYCEFARDDENLRAALVRDCPES